MQALKKLLQAKGSKATFNMGKTFDELKANSDLVCIAFSFNPFMPTDPTFAVRETDVSPTANVGTVGKNGLISTSIPATRKIYYII